MRNVQNVTKINLIMDYFNYYLNKMTESEKNKQKKTLVRHFKNMTKT